MDALALLCNLYGDGPKTLRRLREAGLRTCSDVGRLELDDLAHLLGGTRDAAQRFRSEADDLAARLRGTPAPARANVGVLVPAQAERAHDPRIEAALAEWRERDAHDEPVAEDEDVPPPPAADPGLAAEPLRPQILDGLDMETCVKLREAGVDSVEDLAEGEALDLAQSMDLGVTRMIRLQFLARRFVEGSRDRRPLREAPLLPSPPRRAAGPARMVHLPPRFSPADPRSPQPRPAGLESDLAEFGKRTAPHGEAAEDSAGPFA